MIKRIINKYFRNYRDKGYLISLGSCSIHLDSPTLWTDIWRSLKEEITFRYNYYFKFKTATVSLKEIKGKWDHVPCKKLYTHNKPERFSESEYYKFPRGTRLKRLDSGYDWDSLIKSISTSKTWGLLSIKKLSPMFFDDNDYKLTAKGYKYRVINGNHRIAVLKCLYGVDHKIKIKYKETEKNIISKSDTVTIQINNGRTDLELTPIKVKLKEVEMDYPDATLEELENMEYCYDNHIPPYPWKRFIEDIKTNGLQEKPIIMLKKTITINFPTIYTIFNGNHRIKALELLYGKEYEVDVHLYKTMKNNLEYIESVKKLKKENMNNILKERFKDLNKKIQK